MRRLLQILFFAAVVRPFLALFIGLRVRGREHLPAADPFVLIANHTSHLDTVALLSLFPLGRLHRIRPVAAADYFLSGRLRAWLSTTLFGILPVARRHVTKANNPLETMRAALAAGDSLILFPEGTRGADGEPGHFLPGVAHLAESCPDVPSCRRSSSTSVAPCRRGRSSRCRSSPRSGSAPRCTRRAAAMRSSRGSRRPWPRCARCAT